MKLLMQSLDIHFINNGHIDFICIKIQPVDEEDKEPKYLYRNQIILCSSMFLPNTGESQQVYYQ